MSAAAPSPDPPQPELTLPPPAPKKPRLVPALLLVAAYWTAWLVVTVFFAGTFTQFMTLFYAPLALVLGIVVWWLAFSRLPWLERVWGVQWLAIGGGLAWLLADKSIAPPPLPMGLLMYALPVAITAVVVWTVATRGAANWTVRWGLAAISLLAWGYFTLVRVDGIDGNLTAERSWRWTPTPEQQFLQTLASASSQPQPLPTIDPSELVAAPGDWPEFRGPARDGRVSGVRLSPDWTTNPPQLLWRRRVGPGWSSFVTIGPRGFTQEQRGEQEAVVCFEIATGQEIWAHLDKDRFWDVVAGAGPRATPTFHEGKLYTQGGSGRLNCLEAATGNVVWTRNIADDAQAKPPMWGFSSSPLVTAGAAIAFAGGKNGKSLLAYDAATGSPRWTGGKGEHSYSSPQLFQPVGGEQVLMVSDYGLESFDPASGQLLWEHNWFLQGIFRVCQPHVADDQILVGTGMGNGTRLLEVAREGEAWKIAEKWTSKDLKPYFNDFVRHEGFLYGFDGDIFTCVDLETGKRKWKKGRYGHGQVLLAADQGLLVVLSEKGELVLLAADPQNHVERGKLQAFAGKTWNHPVIAGDKLLVRNGEEMACYELAAGGTSAAD